MYTRKSRRQSLYSDQLQKCSQTFTDSHSMSLHQSTLNRNYLSNLEFDNKINNPFTFMDKTKTSATRKKFQFQDNNSMKKICNVMDDFISKLDESSEYQECEKQLFNKLHFIQFKHEQLKQKYKNLEESIKFERFEKEVLERQLIELNYKLKEERMKRQLLHQNYIQQRKIYQSMKLQCELNQKYISNLNSNEETMRQFLKYQIRKLKKNNKLIDDYSIEHRNF